MTEYKEIKQFQENETKHLEELCEECKNKDESVFQNLILIGFKICRSCRISKTLFPI